MPSLESITIRTDLRPGDIGTITRLHGQLYNKEYDWGVGFEAYVASGLAEFYEHYDPSRSRIWIAEDDSAFVGCLALLDRGEAAQLRYYLVLPEYRGIGLGKKMMSLFMDFYRTCGYRSAYLWTTRDLESAAHLYTRVGFQLAEEKESEGFGRAVIEQRYELVQTT